MKTNSKTLTCVFLFAIAMAFLESAVVIYLRELFYKGGFAFPLKPMPKAIVLVELLREAATIIMLAGIGYLAGKTKTQRFAHFILAFALWDLFYYIFLYLFPGWPPSLFTWDILFLIPLPWVGPVWAPCLLCLLMITGSVFYILRTHGNNEYPIEKLDWFLLIAGAFLCILSFMWEYIRSYGGLTPIASNMQTYLPQSFNYLLFFTGFACMSYPVFTNILSKK